MKRLAAAWILIAASAPVGALAPAGDARAIVRAVLASEARLHGGPRYGSPCVEAEIGAVTFAGRRPPPKLPAIRRKEATLSVPVKSFPVSFVPEEELEISLGLDWKRPWASGSERPRPLRAATGRALTGAPGDRRASQARRRR